MAYDSLSMTSLLQVVDQQTCHKLIVKTCYPQACCKLFQQVLANLQMTSYNKLVNTDSLKLDKIDKFVATF